MPTGWRPADVKARYPISSASSGTFKKYRTNPSRNLQIWSWVQLGVLISMVFHILITFVNIGFPMLFYYGAFLYLMVYSYTTLMDLSKYALWLETCKSMIAIGIIAYTGSWFGLEKVLPFGHILVLIYMVISVIVVAYFTRNEVADRQLNVSLN